MGKCWRHRSSEARPVLGSPRVDNLSHCATDVGELGMPAMASITVLPRSENYGFDMGPEGYRVGRACLHLDSATGTLYSFLATLRFLYGRGSGRQDRWLSDFEMGKLGAQRGSGYADPCQARWNIPRYWCEHRFLFPAGCAYSQAERGDSL